jgi:hypothetical protein
VELPPHDEPHFNDLFYDRILVFNAPRYLNKLPIEISDLCHYGLGPVPRFFSVQKTLSPRLRACVL